MNEDIQLEVSDPFGGSPLRFAIETSSSGRLYDRVLTVYAIGIDGARRAVAVVTRGQHPNCQPESRSDR